MGMIQQSINSMIGNAAHSLMFMKQMDINKKASARSKADKLKMTNPEKREEIETLEKTAAGIPNKKELPGKSLLKMPSIFSKMKNPQDANNEAITKSNQQMAQQEKFLNYKKMLENNASNVINKEWEESNGQ